MDRPAARVTARPRGIAPPLGGRADRDRLGPQIDLLVHPAHREGLGVALLEAAAGVPIVAARAGGVPEVVRDGENGLLVPPGDPEALAAAVNGLLDDPDQCRAVGATARRGVVERFSVARMLAGNLQVYRAIVASCGAEL